MKWANFLHFYQPANQQKDILEAVVNQCYRPLLGGLLKKERAKLTINISGSLLELLDRDDHHDVIDLVCALHDKGTIELTSTACYHAFLPLLPVEETIRQITLNTDLIAKYIGKSVKFAGFFPPEMGVNSSLLKILSDMGFLYMLADEVACKGCKNDEMGKVLFKSVESQQVVFFRQRKPSNTIMSGIERFSGAIAGMMHDYSDKAYLITAMDGETFGHHRPGLEIPFLELFDNERLEFSTINDLLSLNLPAKPVTILASTWASSYADIAQDIQFISWRDPANTLHTWQWELVNLMLKLIRALDKNDPGYQEIRSMADKALASDQFFWASAKPWWSVEMIEAGAFMCLEVVEKLPGVSPADVTTARTLYRQIISTAFDWQRTGKIREMTKERSAAQRIPFKTRTLEAGGLEPAVYHAFVDLMKEQEQKAAAAGEYEKAILWRDAVYKIETKNDIYDAINAIDLLRLDLSNEQVEQVISRYKEDYRRIRGGQPEQRSN